MNFSKDLRGAVYRQAFQTNFVTARALMRNSATTLCKNTWRKQHGCSTKGSRVLFTSDITLVCNLFNLSSRG